jgi:release factor glutamine methyltransferase
MATLADALRQASALLADHHIATARLDAEVLLCHVLGRDRAWLLAHHPDPIDEDTGTMYSRVLDRRATREPLQYITGSQEFWGLLFLVTPEVLIPRPETELVVETALGLLENAPPALVIDLCTGSGCIAVSLANELPAARFLAVDRSPEALAVARTNARTHGASDRIRFFEGDLFSPLAGIDLGAAVITANPPYIRTDELPTLQPEVRDFEPEVALVAGPKGTELAERIVTDAPRHLLPGGSLIMEMGIGQAGALQKIILKNGSYSAAKVLKDLAGIERVIVAQRK